MACGNSKCEQGQRLRTTSNLTSQQEENMRRKRLVGAIVVCGLLFFAFVPFVHEGAVGPYPYDTHPSNYVYQSLSCRTVGLGATFWGGHYELGCGPLNIP